MAGGRSLLAPHRGRSFTLEGCVGPGNGGRNHTPLIPKFLDGLSNHPLHTQTHISRPTYTQFHKVRFSGCDMPLHNGLRPQRQDIPPPPGGPDVSDGERKPTEGGGERVPVPPSIKSGGGKSHQEGFLLLGMRPERHPVFRHILLSKHIAFPNRPLPRIELDGGTHVLVRVAQVEAHLGLGGNRPQQHMRRKPNANSTPHHTPTRTAKPGA